MTKEETITNLKAYLNGDTAIGNIVTLRSVLESAIRCLETPLPSNLDEAAEEYMGTIRQFGDASFTLYADVDVKNAFKAGAEWMAGQGETKRGVATQDHFIQFADDTYIDLDPTMKLTPAFRLKDAEEIFVQIRKKQ